VSDGTEDPSTEHGQAEVVNVQLVVPERLVPSTLWMALVSWTVYVVVGASGDEGVSVAVSDDAS
jgi:hypothetical protein